MKTQSLDFKLYLGVETAGPFYDITKIIVIGITWHREQNEQKEMY
jgi:hypothetical protein